MVPPRIGMYLAVVCCALACGERPDPPGPAMSSGAGMSGGAPSGAGSAPGDVDPPSGDDNGGAAGAPSEPETPPDVPVASGDPLADAGPPPVVPVGGDDEDPPASVVQTAIACTENAGGCLLMNIAVSDDDSESCIQLALDNCEATSQPGLAVDLPVSWRLGSASVNQLEDECEPGAPFDPRFGSAVVGATGSIGWNVTTRFPSELVLDLTLEPSSTADDPTPVRVANSDLVEQLPECD